MVGDRTIGRWELLLKPDFECLPSPTPKSVVLSPGCTTEYPMDPLRVQMPSPHPRLPKSGFLGVLWVGVT